MLALQGEGRVCPWAMCVVVELIPAACKSITMLDIVLSTDRWVSKHLRVRVTSVATNGYRIGIGVGTPHRLLALLDSGQLIALEHFSRTSVFIIQ